MSNAFGKYKLKELDINLIDVGKRARLDYGNLDELARSMTEVGVIQPLSVVVKAMLSRDDGADAIVEEDETKPYLLLAGGRRFEAIKLAGYETVPCKIYTNTLSDEEVFKIELYENIYRKEMTWSEETLLRDKIHRLNLKSKGIIVDEGAVSTAKLKESAAEMGMSIGMLSTDLRIAQAIKDIPELANLKSKAEIRKVLKHAKNSADIKKNLDKLNAEMSSETTTQVGVVVPKNIVHSVQNRYILGDFFERSKELPDGTFDLVVCDPMYGIEFENLSQNNETMRTGVIKDIPSAEYPAYIDKLVAEVVRLMKPDSWLLMWHAMRWEPMILETMERHGLKTKDRPIIWVKKPAGNMAPEYQLSSAWEPCLYARKGTPRLDLKQIGGDVVIFDAPDKGNRVHPTEKPFRMVGQLIRTFSPMGAKVLVPFAGSGVDLAYCASDFREAIGFDIVESLKNAYDLRIAKNDFQGHPVISNMHLPASVRGDDPAMPNVVEE